MLLAEGLNRIGSVGQGFGELDPDNLFDEAIRLYKEVRDTKHGRLVTPQLVASAQNNIGNAHYYKGNYETALLEWGKTFRRHPERKSVGTLANVVAANIVLGNVDDAIRLGKEGS